MAQFGHGSRFSQAARQAKPAAQMAPATSTATQVSCLGAMCRKVATSQPLKLLKGQLISSLYNSRKTQENARQFSTTFGIQSHQVALGPVNEPASSDFQAVNNANLCEFQDMSGQHSPPLWVSGNPVRRLAAVEILPMMGGPQHQYGHDVVQGIWGIYTRAPKTCKWMRVRWAYSTKKSSGI